MLIELGREREERGANHSTRTSITARTIQTKHTENLDIIISRKKFVMLTVLDYIISKKSTNAQSKKLKQNLSKKKQAKMLTK